MKSKTQILTICGCALITLIGFFSCKKDNSDLSSAVNASNVDDVIIDTTSDSTLTKGLIAWYTFNGDVLDHSGHRNNVVFNSATPTRGKAGVAKTAYKFDGIASYMQVANSKSLNPQRISLYALIKPTGFYQGTCHGNYIISKEYSDADNGRYLLGFDDQLYYNYSGCFDTVATRYENFYGTYGDAGAAASGANDDDEYVRLNHWYSIVYTFDGIHSNLYVNGRLVNQVTKSTTFNANSNPVLFGKTPNPNYPYYFNGIIDEIRIYNRALKPTEVSELNNNY